MIARRFIGRVWNAGDLGAADDLVHPDYAVPGVGRGPEGVKRNVAAFREAFPDLEWTIEEMVAEGDVVAARMLCGAPTGATFEVSPRRTSA